MSTSTFNFTTGLCGFQPLLNQTTTFKQERNNCYDCFAIAAMGKLSGTLASSIVGHIPRELSRLIWYTIKNGARITAMVLSAKAKNSPLRQGGLEKPISIKVNWENETNLERLKTKVSSHAYSPEDNYLDDLQ